jgi:hypothetical protein
VEEKAGSFLLFAADGRFVRPFASGDGAAQEYQYTTSYAIEGGELRSVFTSEADSGRRETTREIELTGLTPAGEEGAERRVRELRESQAAAGAALAKAAKERLASFERALPDAPGDLDFVFAYDGRAIVVRGPGGAEIWREPDYPYRGKDLFPRLREVLRRRYGPRLRSFTTYLPDMDSSMAFDPE